jgi:hypothetical protein
VTTRFGRKPWGWRDGTVLSVFGQWATVVYTRHPGIVRLRHHEPLAAELSPGTRVGVHEEQNALAGPFGVLDVLVDGAGQPVRPPRWWLRRRHGGRRVPHPLG